MKHKLLLAFLILLTIGIASADISITSIVSPSSQWYNTYSLILNVTTNDYANVTFTTSKYATLTTLYTNDTQGNMTLNSTFLDESSNTITIYAKNATNQLDLDIAAVAGVNVDVSAPAWNPIPTDQLSEYGEDFAYDVNASDAQTITYSLNATNFAVNESGFISNTTALGLSTDHIQINATDLFNQTNTTSISISIQDTTPPLFNPPLQNLTLIFREILNYDINASDLSNISIYFINDTSNFTINNSGLLSNTTFLPDGDYYLNISVNDTYNNIQSQSIRITVSSCIEDWVCTEWSTCSKDSQSRTCTDNNLCDTELNKPIEGQTCSSGGHSPSPPSPPVIIEESSSAGGGGGGGTPSKIKQPVEEIEVIETAPPEETPKKPEPLTEITGAFIETPRSGKGIARWIIFATLMCAVGTFVYYRLRKNKKKSDSFGF